LLIALTTGSVIFTNGAVGIKAISSTSACPKSFEARKLMNLREAALLDVFALTA
jgi:hypothetical protein